MRGQVLDTRVVAIGNQNFEDMISHNNFYIDKTHFIKEWWENRDSVTLITRPRRFGKTLLMSMVEQFFSVEHKDNSCLFEGLGIFKEEAYRELQGTCPVIFLSFASIKETTLEGFYEQIQNLLAEIYRKYAYLLASDIIGKAEKRKFQSILDEEASENTLANSLRAFWAGRD